MKGKGCGPHHAEKMNLHAEGCTGGIQVETGGVDAQLCGDGGRLGGCQGVRGGTAGYDQTDIIRLDPRPGNGHPCGGGAGFRVAPHTTDIEGGAQIAVFCVPDIIEGQCSASCPDADPLQNPVLRGADIQILQKAIGNDVFRIIMSKAV